MTLLVFLLLSCSLDIDWYRAGKKKIEQKKWELAKGNFNRAIEENHPKKDSAIYYLKIIDSLELEDNRNKKILAEQKLNKEAKDFLEILDGIKKSQAPNSLESIFIELGIYKSSWEKVVQLKQSNGDSTLKNADKLEAMLKATQIKRFPLFRKTYSEQLDQKLWENNIDCFTSHSKNKVLNLTGAAFANNKNIKEAQEMINENVVQLRFSQIRYKWYDGDDEYQYFKLEEEKDSDPF